MLERLLENEETSLRKINVNGSISRQSSLFLKILFKIFVVKNVYFDWKHGLDLKEIICYAPKFLQHSINTDQIRETFAKFLDLK